MENIKILFEEKIYEIPYLWINNGGYCFCEKKDVLGKKYKKLIDRIIPISVMDKDNIVNEYLKKLENKNNKKNYRKNIFYEEQEENLIGYETETPSEYKVKKRKV